VEGKPIKAKNLKVIDHLGTLYATFDGSSMWKLDKVAFGILRMCDGKRTVEDIVDELAKRISHKPEDVKPVVEEILNELTKMKFIEWV
jgi:hypothetical protein